MANTTNAYGSLKSPRVSIHASLIDATQRYLDNNVSPAGQVYRDGYYSSSRIGPITSANPVMNSRFDSSSPYHNSSFNSSLQSSDDSSGFLYHVEGGGGNTFSTFQDLRNYHSANYKQSQRKFEDMRR
jgi:hypothetical protein